MADVRLGNFGAAEDPVDRVSRRNAVICYEESGGIVVDTFLRGQVPRAASVGSYSCSRRFFFFSLFPTLPQADSKHGNPGRTHEFAR